MKRSQQKLVAVTLIAMLTILVTGCTANNEAIKMAHEGWEEVGGYATRGFEGYGGILICQYSSKALLYPDADLEYASFYKYIPSSGTVIIYDTDEVGFDDLNVVFFSSSGQIVETFSYEEWDELFEYYYSIGSRGVYYADELAKALICIANCNYISGMYNRARDKADPDSKVPRKLEENRWYLFSDKQEKAIVDYNFRNNGTSIGFDLFDLEGLSIFFRRSSGSMFLITGIIVYFVLAFFIASVAKKIAEKKGHDGHKYFWWTFWLGLVGMLMVAALPYRRINREDSPKQLAVKGSISSGIFDTDELPEL